MGVPFSPEELATIDLTCRMFCEPTLLGDTALLGEIWTAEAKRKREIMASLGVTESDLQSADRFADLLRAEGVEPETKPGKNGLIFAFAKTDEFMRELLEDDDERIRTLAEARLGVKSTLEQTRSERLGFMAGRGPLPVYLNYCGTHTTLWSGGDGINWQNFKRGGDLRKAILAPPGWLLAKVDQSQVQCRIAEYLGGEYEALEDFRQKKDPYLDLPSKFYGRPITKEDKEERQFGKILRLSCQFGAGASTIQKSGKNAQVPVYLTDTEALMARDLYRRERPGVVTRWKDGDRILGLMVQRWKGTVLGILRVEGTTIVLPNGAPMHWPELQWDVDWQSYKFLYKRNRWRRIWGGFWFQNIVSGLASTLVRQAMLRIHAKGFRIVLQEHDAVGVLIPDNLDRDRNLEFIIQEMSRAPEWMPDIPLAAEGSVGRTYS